jgi:hypothetical protein
MREKNACLGCRGDDGLKPKTRVLCRIKTCGKIVRGRARFGALVLRILVEERFLRRELKGYDAYMKRVRYRLVPYVW